MAEVPEDADTAHRVRVPLQANENVYINTFQHQSALVQEQQTSASGEGAASHEDDASNDVFDSEAMEQASRDMPGTFQQDIPEDDASNVVVDSEAMEQASCDMPGTFQQDTPEEDDDPKDGF